MIYHHSRSDSTAIWRQLGREPVRQHLQGPSRVPPLPRDFILPAPCTWTLSRRLVLEPAAYSCAGTAAASCEKSHFQIRFATSTPYCRCIHAGNPHIYGTPHIRHPPYMEPPLYTAPPIYTAPYTAPHTQAVRRQGQNRLPLNCVRMETNVMHAPPGTTMQPALPAAGGPCGPGNILHHFQP